MSAAGDATSGDRIEPCAMWTDDCQGKKDYDGRLLSISTRYWPEGGGAMTVDTATGVIGNLPYGPKPSAVASIDFNFGKPDTYGFGDYVTWKEQRFEADTEAEVKAQVEAWVREKVEEVRVLLGIPRASFVKGS